MPRRRRSRLPAGDAEDAPPAAVYARYLESLASRPNHGDHAFPRDAAAALVAGVADRAKAPRAAVAARASGRWFVAQAVEMALLATAAAAFERRLRQDMAWAAVVLPVGVFLGPALVRVLGGAALWSDCPAALRAAAFAGRLDGVPARALGLLARLGGEGVATDATSRRLARPTVALAQAALAADLGPQVAQTAMEPEHAVARALALRYGERIRRFTGSPPWPA